MNNKYVGKMFVEGADQEKIKQTLATIRGLGLKGRVRYRGQREPGFSDTLKEQAHGAMVYAYKA